MSDVTSTNQFGGVTGEQFQSAPSTPTPLSYSAGTSSTAARATSWATRDLSHGSVLPLSNKTFGTLYKFNDNQSMPDTNEA